MTLALPKYRPKSLWSYNPIPRGCDLFLPIWNSGLHGPVYKSIDPFGHTVTRTGGVFDSDGHWRTDGNDVQKVTYNAVFDYTAAMSIGGWFYIDPADATNDGNHVGLISKADRVTANGGYYMSFKDDDGNSRIYFLISDGAAAKAVGANNNCTSAGWYFAMATYDNSVGGTEELQLFLGTPTTIVTQNNATDTAVTIATNAYPISIAAQDNGAGGSKEYVDARFKVVWLYDRALFLEELVYIQRMTVGRLT